MNYARITGIALAGAMTFGQAVLSAPVVSVPDNGDMLWSLVTMLMGATDGTVGFGARIENDTTDPMSLRLEFSTNGWSSAETAVFAMNDAIVLSGTGVVTDPRTGTVSNVTCASSGLFAGKNVVGVLWDAKRQLGPVDIEGVQLRWVAWTEAGETSVSDPVLLDLHFAETADFSQPSSPPDIVGGVGFAVVDGQTVFNLSFQGEAGFTYLLQYKRTLADPAWTTLQTVSPSATGVIPVAIPILPETTSAFFRVVVAADAAPGGGC